MNELLLVLLLLFVGLLGVYVVVVFLYKDILKEIKNSIKPLFLKVDITTNLITDLMFSVWQLDKNINKIKATDKEINTRTIDSTFNKIKNIFKTLGFESIDYTNKKFNEGLNVDIVATNKVNNTIEPYIKETIEPTILYKGNIIKKAKVIVEITGDTK